MGDCDEDCDDGQELMMSLLRSMMEEADVNGGGGSMSRWTELGEARGEGGEWLAVLAEHPVGLVLYGHDKLWQRYQEVEAPNFHAFLICITSKDHPAPPMLEQEGACTSQGVAPLIRCPSPPAVSGLHRSSSVPIDKAGSGGDPTSGPSPPSLAKASSAPPSSSSRRHSRWGAMINPTASTTTTTTTTTSSVSSTRPSCPQGEYCMLRLFGKCPLVHNHGSQPCVNALPSSTLTSAVPLFGNPPGGRLSCRISK